MTCCNILYACFWMIPTNFSTTDKIHKFATIFARIPINVCIAKILSCYLHLYLNTIDNMLIEWNVYIWERLKFLLVTVLLHYTNQPFPIRAISFSRVQNKSMHLQTVKHVVVRPTLIKAFDPHQHRLLLYLTIWIISPQLGKLLVVKSSCPIVCIKCRVNDNHQSI